MFKPTVFSLSTYSALFPVLFVCISQVFLSTSILCGDLNAKVIDKNRSLYIEIDYDQFLLKHVELYRLPLIIKYIYRTPLT
jgi:hypothetical protein